MNHHTNVDHDNYPPETAHNNIAAFQDAVQNRVSVHRTTHPISKRCYHLVPIILTFFATIIGRPT